MSPSGLAFVRDMMLCGYLAFITWTPSHSFGGGDFRYTRHRAAKSCDGPSSPSAAEHASKPCSAV